MTNLQVGGTGLLVAVVALAVTLPLLAGPYLWLGSICGLALFLVLLGFDREGYRSAVESLGYAAVVALALTETTAAILRVLSGSLAAPAPLESRIGTEWMPAIWVFVTLVFWPIDRARMSGRLPQAALPSSSGAMIFQPAPQPVPAPAVSPLQVAPEIPRSVAREPFVPPPPPPPVPAPAPARAPVQEPVTTSLRPTFTQPAFAETAPEPQVSYAPPPPVPAVPAQAAPIHYAPPPPPPVTPPYVPPAAPQPVPIPAGKEAMIYVTLVGEGLNVLRAVRAENLGRDYYKIVEEMPEGETWQFGPGQVVRCKKRNLSSGKAMVATEEAQRAR